LLQTIPAIGKSKKVEVQAGADVVEDGERVVQKSKVPTWFFHPLQCLATPFDTGVG